MNIKGTKLRILSLAVVLLLALSSIVMVSNNDGSNAYATPAVEEGGSGTTFGEIFANIGGMLTFVTSDVELSELEKIEITELNDNLTISKNSYFATSSLAFGEYYITVAKDTTLYIIDDIDLTGYVDIVVDGTICLGNVELSGVEIVSSDGISIKYSVAQSGISSGDDSIIMNQWNVNLTVNVNGELSIIKDIPEDLSEIESQELKVKNSGPDPEIELSLLVQFDKSLYGNENLFDINGFLNFINDLIADKQLIPVIDISVDIDNLEYKYSDEDENQFLNVYELSLSVITSSSRDYVNVDFSIAKLEYEHLVYDVSLPEERSVDEKISLILEESLFNVVINDKLNVVIASTQAYYVYDSVERQISNSYDIKKFALNLSTSIDNFPEIVSNPFNLSNIKAEFNLVLSADYVSIYRCDKSDGTDIIQVGINDLNLNLAFNTNGTIDVSVSASDIRATGELDDPLNNRAQSDVLALTGVDVKLKVDDPKVVEAIFKIIDPTGSMSRGEAMFNGLAILLDDCKVEVSAGLNSLEISSTKVDSDDESVFSQITAVSVSSPSVKADEHAVKINVNLSSKAGKYLFKPTVDLKVDAVFNKDVTATYSIIQSVDGTITNSDKLEMTGIGLNGSMNGTLDLMAFMGERERLSQIDVAAGLSVDKVVYDGIINDGKFGQFAYAVFSGIEFSIDSDLYGILEDLFEATNLKVSAIDVKGGKLDEKGNPDISKVNRIIFKEGAYNNDEHSLAFSSFDVESTITECTSTVESDSSLILPYMFTIGGGIFYCGPYPLGEIEEESGIAFTVPYYEVSGGYFGDKARKIQAGVSVKVASEDMEGFLGWYVNGVKYNPGDIIVVDKDLRISEIRESDVKITLIVDGKTLTILTGKSNYTTMYDAPEKENYNFVGWQKKGSTEPVSYELKFEDGAEYEAVYSELPKIEFYYDGKLLFCEHGEEGAWADYEAPFIEGKVFNYWKNESGEEVNPVFAEEPQKLYAYYTDMVTITFIVDGKEFAKVTDAVGTKIDAPTPADKTDSYFVGWFEDCEFTKPVTEFKIGEADVSYYAKYDDYYKVIFSMNGETETFYGLPLEIVPMTNVRQFDGKRFVGMYSDAEFKNPVSVCKFGEGDEKVITYYAKYADTQKVTFLVNGEVFDVQWGDVGKIIIPKSPEIDNFRFDGWFVDKDLKTLAESFVVAEEDTIYYAKMVAAITVKFYVDGEEYFLMTYDEGFEYSVDPPSKSGFRFMGWYDNPDFNGEPAVVGKLTVSCNYYAKFAKEYKITFVEDGKTLSEYTFVGIAGESTNNIPKPAAKAGYEFMGWYCGAVMAGDKITIGDCNEEYEAKYAPVVTPSTDKKDGEIVVDESMSESISISKTDLEKVANNLEDTEVLKIILKNGTIVLPKNAISKINDSDSFKSFSINLGTTGLIIDKISDSDKEKILNGLMVSVDIKNASDLKGLGKVKIVVPYTLPSGMDANEIVVYYVDSNGNLEKHNSRYFVADDGLGYVEFETDHLSDFVIGKGASSDGGNAIVYAAIAVVLVIVAIGVFFLYKKRQVA